MSDQPSKHEGQKQPAGALDPAGPAARALTAFDAQTESTDGDEDRAWRRLRQHLRGSDDPAARPEARQSRVQRWLFVGGTIAGLVIAGALAVEKKRPLVSQRTEVAAPPATATAPPVPSLKLSNVPRPLPAGRTRLDEDIAATAAPGTKAVFWVEGAGERHVDLTSGVVELHVSGTVHPGLVVHAGDYRFRDRGTVFEVRREGRAVWLHVKAGAVAVSKGRRALAVVGADQRWSVGVADAPPDARARPTAAATPALATATATATAISARTTLDAPARSDTTPPGPAPTEQPAAAPEALLAPAPTVRRRTLPDCQALEQQQRDDEALACLRRLAEGNDLTAETALYELARVQRERLGDDTAALATLQKQRHRFPNGALRDEAELTTIELLPQLRRYRSALDLSDAFLARHPRHERAAELHLLRANILREVFADYAAAVREYQEINAAEGGVGDDAAFFLAVALEADGRKQDATDAYRRYLKRAAPTRAAVARARLGALTR